MKLQVCFKSDKSDALHEGVSTFILLTGVRNVLQIDNSLKGSLHWVSVTTVSGFILLTDTCGSVTAQRQSIVACGLQKWIGEGTCLKLCPTF